MSEEMIKVTVDYVLSETWQEAVWSGVGTVICFLSAVPAAALTAWGWIGLIVGMVILLAVYCEKGERLRKAGLL